MREMIRISKRSKPLVLHQRPKTSQRNNPNDASGVTKIRPKPMVLVLDSLKKTNASSLVYMSPDFLIARDERTILEMYQKKRTFKPSWIYQESAVAFGKARESDVDGLGTRGFLLCDEMGMGKTKSILTLILEQNQADSLRSGRRFNGPTLVVCKDMTIIEQTWLKEMESFPDHTFFYEIITTDFVGEENREYLENCCDIVFTTYSTVTNNRHPVLFELVWRRIAADEVHRIVNQNTDLFTAMSLLQSPIKIGITGTPKQNHDSDIVTLCRFVGLQLEKEREIPLEKIMLRRFNKDFQEEGKDGEKPVYSLPEKREPVSRMIEYVPFATNQEKLLYCVYAKLALQRKTGLNITYLISIMRELCICPAVIKHLILPDCLIPFGQKYIPPEVMEMKQTCELKRILSSLIPQESFHLQYKNGDSYLSSQEKEKEEEMGYEFEWEYKDTSILTKSNIWKELSSSPDWSEPVPTLRRNPSSENCTTLINILDRVIRFDRPMSKERVILEHVERTPREDKIVIFSGMIEPLERMARFIKEYLGFESVIATGDTKNQNTQRIEKFRKDPNIKILLMTLKFGNEALNIPEANYLYFIDPWWNPSVMLQGEFRIQRPGQKKKVYIVYFIMNHTIECYVMKQTEKKNNIQASLSLAKLKKESSPLFDYSVSFK